MDNSTASFPALSTPDYPGSTAAPAPVQGTAEPRNPAELPPPTPAPSMPQTALDAALLLVELPLPLRLVPVFASGATLPLPEAASTRAEILARRKDWRRAVGVADVSGLLVALDPDNEAAELVAADLVGDAATLRIQSRRGVHRVFLRGDVLPPELRANLVFDERRPAEALAPKLDVVTGAVRLWHRDKTWINDPAGIEPMPPRLREAVAACWSARCARVDGEAAAARERAALAEAERQRRGSSEDTDRLGRWAAAALSGRLGDVAACQAARRNELYAAGIYLRRLDLAGWAGPIDVEGELLAAAHRNGYAAKRGERRALSHIRRGIRAGDKLGPLPEPPSRELVRLTMPPARVAEIEARAAAACADTAERAKARGIHPRTALKVAMLADELARRAVEAGSSTVYASLADLGLKIDRNPAAVFHAVPALRRLGFSVTLGGIGDADRAKATAWTLPKAAGGALPQIAMQCREPHATGEGGGPERIGRPRCDVLVSPGGVAVRGLRRRLSEDLPGCGDSPHRVLGAIAAASSPPTVAAIADATGLSPDTVRRSCRGLLVRGVLAQGRVATAGRSAATFDLTEAGRRLLRGVVDGAAEVIRATVAAGERVIRRAAAALDAGRARLARARELAQSLGVSVAAALARLRADAALLASAERDPAHAARAAARSRAAAEHHRADSRAQLIADRARRAWLQAELTRQGGASVGLVPA